MLIKSIYSHHTCEYPLCREYHKNNSALWPSTPVTFSISGDWCVANISVL